MKGVRALPRGAEGRVPVVGVLPLREAEGERGAVVEEAAQAVPLPPRRRRQHGHAAGGGGRPGQGCEGEEQGRHGHRGKGELLGCTYYRYEHACKLK